MDIGNLKKTTFFVFTFCLLILNSKAQKTDTVYFLNGDKITGEIKRLEYGLLYLSTDAMLVINIPYDRINTISSAKLYELVTNAGVKYFGSITKSATRASIVIVTPTDSIEKPLWDIVNIAYLKTKFFQRMDGSIDVGFSYTKASDVLQYNLAGWVTYRIKLYAFRADLSSILTDQKNDGGTTKNNDYSVGLTRYLPQRWFVKAQEKFQQNTELELDFRLQSFVGPGYDFIRTNKNRLYGIVGINYNIEQPFKPAELSKNFEGLIAVQYRWVQFRHPNKVDLTTGFNYFSSFSIKDRYRLEYSISAKIEIINDLYFNVKIYENYDSKTIFNESEKNDYGVVTSLSYIF